MQVFDLRRLLALPELYSLLGRLAGGKARRTYVDEYLRPQPGHRVLDIGCGPGDILDYLPPTVSYTGFDVSQRYIESARSRFGHRGSFFCEAVNCDVIHRIGQSDVATASGVLHHLDDGDALELFRIARASLAPGGRLITLDGCYTHSQTKLARYFVSKDRGQYVRTPESLESLARQVFTDVTVSLRHDLMRIPYTLMIMECSTPPAAADVAHG